MHQRLKDLYGHVSVLATADREHEAAIELLLLMMMVDHHFTEPEIDEIRQISDDSGWESATFSFDQYLGQAMAKVREAMNTDGLERLLDDIDQRVTNSILRAELFSAARDVAGADHSIDPKEESLLGQIAARFG
ncbi:MAG: hypothetical protein F2681_07585 [Actinobacteria bacterium]|uniref:Unannotated protein n=1 Tax=freshwater metagenome TaxID=449393 RepID=A0A6J7BWV3_9ZZZZ|nr:hypothetical protein [Actinomycetota bacterium]MSW77144.1 hypothetical protein [Actinomycetota bacterium]MSX55021.1 hypothetical protein [Actinomycetota bacterium]MSX92025.1 hypothetical protein [Actinomycetota bacterium]MSZ82988.1 hypothetical protein [Actinomycetota bacterium]